MDGSHHRWLGQLVPPFALLLAVDDATGNVVNALFCEQENTRDYFLLMRGLVQRYGIPIALYTDRHSVFKNVPGSGLARAPTQFSRAMDELGVQMVFALSVGNQQNWDTLRPERSGVGLRSSQLPECPVVLSSPLDCLGLHFLPAS